jgi:DNA topoisomerase-1
VNRVATTEKSGGKRLVIVESPAKARTISGYLGDGFTVASSVGHIRDLPSRASEIPKEQRAKYGTMGVAIDDEFEPLYLVDKDKTKTVADLKKQLKEADELLLATDEDREGEAIAWHLKEVLKPKVPVSRMVFHEITRDAIERSLEHTRDIDDRLVDAQETRRILDRLYGFEVSPVLWKKVTQGLSAGRVQSVATRLVVERERERIAFVDVSYWDLEGIFDPGSFTARLVALDGRRVARGSDFGSDGKLKSEAIVHLDEDAARGLVERLGDSTFSVRSKDEKPYTRRPTAPFRTATLQQEASRKLRYSSQTTMRVAQRLYENGYITYMRTDSTSLSEVAIAAARRQVTELYGADYVPPKPRTYQRAVKNAQEAHEAIRPAGDRFRTPTEVRGELNRDELALYELIWKRTIASQKADARGQTVSLRLGATSSSDEDVELGASGTVITFPGFLACIRGRQGRRGRRGEPPLPNLEEGPGPRDARADRAGSRDLGAAALHGSDARARARGARHRPAVDVRGDHGARSSTAATSSSAAPRSSRPSSRSPSSSCSRSTSAGSSTTSSPRAWRTTSTASPRARRGASSGCAASTSATETGATSRASRSS